MCMCVRSVFIACASCGNFFARRVANLTYQCMLANNIPMVTLNTFSAIYILLDHMLPYFRMR